MRKSLPRRGSRGRKKTPPRRQRWERGRLIRKQPYTNEFGQMLRRLRTATVSVNAADGRCECRRATCHARTVSEVAVEMSELRFPIRASTYGDVEHGRYMPGNLPDFVTAVEVALDLCEQEKVWLLRALAHSILEIEVSLTVAELSVYRATN